jgi:hypothetical protein
LTLYWENVLSKHRNKIVYIFSLTNCMDHYSFYITFYKKIYMVVYLFSGIVVGMELHQYILWIMEFMVYGPIEPNVYNMSNRQVLQWSNKQDMKNGKSLIYIGNFIM